MDMPNGPTSDIYFRPDWFHNWGHFDISRTNKGLLLANGKAWVRINRSSRSQWTWRVSWMIYHENDNISQGTLFFTTDELKVAFRLTDILPWQIMREPELIHGQYHTQRISFPGFFVRNEIFLNIPGAGIKGDSDPNLSILLDDKIKEAVHQLIKS